MLAPLSIGFVLFRLGLTFPQPFFSRRIAQGPSINDVGNWEGGGVENWSKLTTDSTKKLPTWGRGVSKIKKNGQRRLWMVPQWGGRAAKSKETKRISSHLRPCFSCFSTPKHPLTHVLINNSSRRALLDAMARWWFYRILTLIQGMHILFKLM